MGRLIERAGFVLANMVVMVILHGNSRQFWPKIPYLSLRDESVGEHTRLIFNTLAITTLLQGVIGRLPRARLLPRAAALAAIPLALPAIILFGQRVLRLRGPAAEAYNLAMVPLLPVAAVALEDVLAARLGADRPPPASHPDYASLV